MQYVLSFITKYFWLFFIIAVAVGFIFPKQSAWSIFLLEPIIILIMYLGALKITKEQIINMYVIRQKLIVYIMVSMFMLPVVFYYLVLYTIPGWAEGIFILVAVPAGIATIGLSSIVKGNTGLTAGITILSSLISVVSIPLLSSKIFGSEIQVDSINLLSSLFFWIIIPFIGAICTQYFFPQIKSFKKYISPLTILLVMPAIWAPLGANIDTYSSLSVGELISMLGFLFLLSILLHSIGWMAFLRNTHEDKIAGSLGMGYMNLSLAIIIATKYFGPEAILIVLIYEIPWDIMLIPFSWISSYLERKKQ